MAEEANRSQLPVQGTVSLEDFNALQRDMENLQMMFTTLYNQGAAPSLTHQAGVGTPVTLNHAAPSVPNPISTALPSGAVPVGPSTGPHQQQAPVIPVMPFMPVHEDCESQQGDPNPPQEPDPAWKQKMQQMEETLRAIQGTNAYNSTSFSDLCFFPEMQLPPKFRIPDFHKFNGTSDPMAHLRLYAGALCGYPHPEKLMMQPKLSISYR
jgi:hypothetical protein